MPPLLRCRPPPPGPQRSKRRHRCDASSNPRQPPEPQPARVGGRGRSGWAESPETKDRDRRTDRLATIPATWPCNWGTTFRSPTRHRLMGPRLEQTGSRAGDQRRRENNPPPITPVMMKARTRITVSQKTPSMTVQTPKTSMSSRRMMTAADMNTSIPGGPGSYPRSDCTRWWTFPATERARRRLGPSLIRFEEQVRG